MIPKNDLKYHRDYLKGLTVVKQDFRGLLKTYNGKNVLLVLDPPYINTLQSTYKGELDRKGFDELLDGIQTNYILFSSNTSGFLDILAERNEEKFADYKMVEMTVAHNKDAKGYKDIMVYKSLQ